MVKRQTVWLSTMMVLSLMLIGYYTLGTPPAQTGKSAGITPSSTPTVVTGSPTTGTSIGNTASKSKTNTTPASTTVNGASTSPSDWFVQTALDQQNHQQRLMQTYESTMSDPRASNQVVSAAYQELTALQTQQVNATRVHDELVGQGYPDSLVIFNPNNDVHVYIQASKLTPTAAVQVINLVSQTLGVQSNMVTVTPHA